MTEAQRLEPLSLVSRRAEEGRRSVAKLGVAIKVAAVYRARQLREGRAAGGLWRHREVWEGEREEREEQSCDPTRASRVRSLGTRGVSLHASVCLSPGPTNLSLRSTLRVGHVLSTPTLLPR